MGHLLWWVTAYRHGIEATRWHPDDEQLTRLRHELLHSAISADIRDIHAFVLRTLHADLTGLAILGEAVADPNAVHIVVWMQQHVVNDLGMLLGRAVVRRHPDILELSVRASEERALLSCHLGPEHVAPGCRICVPTHSHLQQYVRQTSHRVG